MSEYENAVAGKLRLKGKPLDVKAVGITKKKKQKKYYKLFSTGNNCSDLAEMNANNILENGGHEVGARYDERLTPAERRYLDQWKHLEAKRLLKNAKESHRDRIEKFNNYLANLSEHYDIPKVGPG